MTEDDSIIVPRAVGEQMRCWLVGDDGATQPEQRIAELEAVLGEARLQLEYLHEKFQPTGTGNAVLARINAALAGQHQETLDARRQTPEDEEYKRQFSVMTDNLRKAFAETNKG